MRILLITGVFPPEMAAGPNLNYELGRELVRLGHSVTVATCFPHYNLKSVPPEYRRKLFMREKMDGMDVHRTWYPRLPKRILSLRGLDIFAMAFAMGVSGLTAREHDVVFVYSPPLTAGLTGILLGRVKGIPFVYNAHDLFPQNAIDLGLLRNRFLIRFFRWIERCVYRQSAHVTAISSGNRDLIIASGARPDRTVIIPDWVDSDFVTPADKDNEFSRRHGLIGKFIVSFSGVMGYSQDLDTVLSAARLLVNTQDIQILLVGDGVEKARLEQEARQNKLTNITFLPMLSRAEVLPVYHSSDVCLATLRCSVKTPPVPSKIAWAMSAGRPVITCINLDSDAPKLIREAKSGICVPPEDPKALAEAIHFLRSNPDECRRMGENGRSYVLKNLSTRSCARRVVELLQETLALGHVAGGRAALPKQTEPEAK